MFWYYLKTPNLTFLNLVIPQYIISFKFWNFECLLNRLCPIFLFLKLVLVFWQFMKTSKFIKMKSQGVCHVIYIFFGYIIFIIVGHVWEIKGRGLPLPPIREQPRNGPSWIGLNQNYHINTFPKAYKNSNKEAFC